MIKKGGIQVDLLELYYKKYTDTVKASDYVIWANHYLYLDVIEIKKLASMNMQKPLNLFEIEEMFAHAMKAIKREDPSKELCIKEHLRQLHSQLLLTTVDAMPIVQELYHCTIEHDLFKEQIEWQEISDAIDDFQYGDNHYGYSKDKINEMIILHARKLWHIKISDISFEEVIGQKIVSIHLEDYFTIQLEKAKIMIECPWRLRNVSEIVIGETDVQSNERKWNFVKELLIGKTIEDIQLLEQCPLLIVQCGNIFLDVFHASSFFDGWSLTDQEDLYIFSMHGGHIV